MDNRANENAASSGRKTISPQDVLKALDDLEFGDFKPRLEAELASSFTFSILHLWAVKAMTRGWGMV